MKAFNGTEKEMERYRSILSDNSIKCKCGRNETIPPHLNKVICSWCGNYVFRTPKEEFKHRMREKMVQNARKQ